MIENARAVIHELNNAGFEAVFVGGFVRDTVMGRTPHDIDIATSATPDEMRCVFGNRIRSNNGEEHGTVLVLMGGEAFEVTTFRADVNPDGRHCEVAFTRSLAEDLMRRDLTVNAMAMTLDGTVINYTPDIEARVIRFVGDADETLRADALRAFRAIRFTVKGFELADSVRPAIRRAVENPRHPLYTKVTAERMRDELLRTLGCGGMAQAVELTLSGLLDVAVPERGMVTEFPYGAPAFNDGDAERLELTPAQYGLALARLAALGISGEDLPFTRSAARAIDYCRYSMVECGVVRFSAPALPLTNAEIQELSGIPFGPEFGKLVRRLVYAVERGATRRDVIDMARSA